MRVTLYSVDILTIDLTTFFTRQHVQLPFPMPVQARTENADHNHPQQLVQHERPRLNENTVAHGQLITDST